MELILDKNTIILQEENNRLSLTFYRRNALRSFAYLLLDFGSKTLRVMSKLKLDNSLNNTIAFKENFITETKEKVVFNAYYNGIVRIYNPTQGLTQEIVVNANQLWEIVEILNINFGLGIVMMSD